MSRVRSATHLIAAVVAKLAPPLLEELAHHHGVQLEGADDVGCAVLVAKRPSSTRRSVGACRTATAMLFKLLLLLPRASR